MDNKNADLCLPYRAIAGSVVFGAAAFIVPKEPVSMDPDGHVDYIGAYLGVAGLVLFNFSWTSVGAPLKGLIDLLSVLQTSVYCRVDSCLHLCSSDCCISAHGTFLNMGRKICERADHAHECLVIALFQADVIIGILHVHERRHLFLVCHEMEYLYPTLLKPPYRGVLLDIRHRGNLRLLSECVISSTSARTGGHGYRRSCRYNRKYTHCHYASAANLLGTSLSSLDHS